MRGRTLLGYALAGAGALLTILGLNAAVTSPAGWPVLGGHWDTEWRLVLALGMLVTGLGLLLWPNRS